MSWRDVGWGVALACVVAVPFVAHALRGDRGARCVADGVSLIDAPVVTVSNGEGSDDLCCVGCALRWLDSAIAAPGSIWVTDLTTGRRIDASEAWFVRSRVVAQVATGDRVHAFESEAAARRHAEAYRGRLLLGSERPFETLSRKN